MCTEADDGCLGDFGPSSSPPAEHEVWGGRKHRDHKPSIEVDVMEFRLGVEGFAGSATGGGPNAFLTGELNGLRETGLGSGAEESLFDADVDSRETLDDADGVRRAFVGSAAIARIMMLCLIDADFNEQIKWIAHTSQTGGWSGFEPIYTSLHPRGA